MTLYEEEAQGFMLFIHRVDLLSENIEDRFSFLNVFQHEDLVSSLMNITLLKNNNLKA